MPSLDTTPARNYTTLTSTSESLVTALPDKVLQCATPPQGSEIIKEGSIYLRELLFKYHKEMTHTFNRNLHIDNLEIMD
jgi:hypothetical protein